MLKERSEVEGDAVNGSYSGEVQRNEVEFFTKKKIEARFCFVSMMMKSEISCSWRLGPVFQHCRHTLICFSN